jgi:hypothetical protein
MHPRVTGAFIVALAVIFTGQAARAVKWTTFEGAAHGFPVMREAASGAAIADGAFLQWIQNGKLHVTITYSGRGRRIEEKVVMRQNPELIQDAWTFTESRNGRTLRRFNVDFGSGRASALTYDEGKEKREDESLKVTGGQTFAGFGFTMVMKALRKRLIAGEHVTLQAVGFSPKPQAVDVDISFGGRDRIRMAGRTIEGDHFVVHPKIPVIAKLFVHVPDAHIWLTTPPAGFLRWEGPLAQPDDTIVRVDLLPGGSSGPASPVATSGRRSGTPTDRR